MKKFFLYAFYLTLVLGHGSLSHASETFVSFNEEFVKSLPRCSLKQISEDGEKKQEYMKAYWAFYAGVERRGFIPDLTEADLTDNPAIRTGSHSSQFSFVHWLNKNNHHFDSARWSEFELMARGTNPGDKQITCSQVQRSIFVEGMQAILLTKGFILEDSNTFPIVEVTFQNILRFSEKHGTNQNVESGDVHRYVNSLLSTRMYGPERQTECCLQ